MRARVLPPPRPPSPSLYAPPAIVLEFYGLMRAASLQVRRLAEVLGNSMDELMRADGEPATIGEFLRGRKVVVYTGWYGEPLAARFSAMLNEYAKTRCYTAVAPELAHNEIEALDGTEAIVTIRDEAGEDVELRAALDSVEELAGERGSALLRVELPGEECLVRYGYGVALLDLAALELARRRGVKDPYGTPNISAYKERLRGRLGR